LVGPEADFFAIWMFLVLVDQGWAKSMIRLRLGIEVQHKFTVSRIL
jgi:hypothetical protein